MIDIALLFIANKLLTEELSKSPPKSFTDDVPIDPGLDPAKRNVSPQPIQKRPKQRDDGTFFGL